MAVNRSITSVLEFFLDLFITAKSPEILLHGLHSLALEKTERLELVCETVQNQGINEP